MLLVAVGSFVVAGLVSYIQSRPVEGRYALLDLLVPARGDPRDRVLYALGTLGVPVTVGGILSLFAADKTPVAAFGVGLGAFFCVNNAFFRPDTLAPPIRAQLWRARLVYAAFVLAFGLLGALGEIIFDTLQQLWRRGNLSEAVVGTLVANWVYGLLGLVARWVTSSVARAVHLSAEQRDRLAREREVQRIVGSWYSGIQRAGR